MKLVKISNTRLLLLTSFLVLTITACNDSSQSVENDAQVANGVEDKSSASSKAQSVKLDKEAYTEVEWIDLMPEDDLEALSNPPGYLDEIEDGSPEDQISSHIQSTIAAATDDRYQQALVSTKVKSEMNGQPIKIPGFIVPVEFNDEQIVTQFFLVPFFGACIHVPPPPPNQIIFVEYQEGLKLESLYEPFWLSGVLETTLVENDIATSSYSLKLHHYENYYDY
ncbi:DUF3299 domain-containing protein [Aliikangiella marina]|uniref:DUF3299 domain-containing protein n=1 Tax=Aliikangiella marina TaxID=1712262 RepID=A0A545T1J1_9GAMM|nr:DUF3299 domain-containing protein [Aliikangiella marina]TQV71086.1 DUF3299 domain-containing protein [Aliikangiella marina]